MYIFLFILGSIFASFLTLVIDRRIKGESIVFPRSHCEHCGHPLHACDLVPIFSFLFLKGRCNYCKKRLPYYYPLMEILGGFFLILTFNISLNLLEFIILSLSIYLGLIIAIMDLRTMEVLSYHLYLLLGLGLLYRYIFLNFDRGFLIFFLVLTIIFLAIYFIFKDSLGNGDLYYYIGLGLFIENSYLLYFVLFSIWLGGIFGLYLAIKNKTTKLLMGFCPYIFLSFIIILILENFGVVL